MTPDKAPDAQIPAGSGVANSSTPRILPTHKRNAVRFFSSSQVMILLIVMPFVIGGTFYGSGVHFKSELFELNIPAYARIMQQDLSFSGVNEDQIRSKLRAARRQLPIAKVLWLDDHPLHNLDQRDSLGLLGIFCDSFTNPDDALSAVKKGSYDMVISNAWDVRPGHQGMDERIQFLEKVRNSEKMLGQRTVPFLFYSNEHASAPEIIQATKDFNATSTSKEAVMLNWVVDHVPPAKADPASSEAN